MKTHPILFSTEMVQAIIQGNKTQTRRVQGLENVNDNPDRYRVLEAKNNWSETKLKALFEVKGSENRPLPQRLSAYCPYGKVGDVLWVRETFCFTGSREYLNSETRMPFMYKADIKDVETAKEVMQDHGWKFRPSIHMPKAACRLFLEITSIRVERLQDITEEDASEEGVECYYDKNGEYVVCSYKDSFEILWSSINGSESWNANPWVWVVEFKRVDKPANFLQS